MDLQIIHMKGFFFGQHMKGLKTTWMQKKSKEQTVWSLPTIIFS